MRILQRRDEKKGMQFESRIARRWRNLTHNAALTFPSNVRLTKFSCVTCKGEQSPSKFDTYSRQLKSTFGWQPDLNTLSARRLYSTFGAKRLIFTLVFLLIKYSLKASAISTGFSRKPFSLFILCIVSS